MISNRFRSEIITQDDVNAYLRSCKDITGRPRDNPQDLRDALPIISAIARNQVKTAGKIEF